MSGLPQAGLVNVRCCPYICGPCSYCRDTETKQRLESPPLRHWNVPAGPPSDSFILGNTQPARRMDRHNLFTEWSNKYGSVVRRRFLDINVSASRLLPAKPLWESIYLSDLTWLDSWTTISRQC